MRSFVPVPPHFKTRTAQKTQAAAREPTWPGKDISMKLQNRHEICTWGQPLNSGRGQPRVGGDLPPVLCSDTKMSDISTRQLTTNRTVFTVFVLGSTSTNVTMVGVGSCCPRRKCDNNFSQCDHHSRVITESWTRTDTVAAVHSGYIYLLESRDSRWTKALIAWMSLGKNKWRE